jgi:hypothetical protein
MVAPIPYPYPRTLSTLQYVTHYHNHYPPRTTATVLLLMLKNWWPECLVQNCCNCNGSCTVGKRLFSYAISSPGPSFYLTQIRGECDLVGRPFRLTWLRFSRLVSESSANRGGRAMYMACT